MKTEKKIPRLFAGIFALGMALVIGGCPTPETNTEPGKKAPQITAFTITINSLDEPVAGVIDQAARTITITVPAGTPTAEFAGVLVKITHNGTSVDPADEDFVDFSALTMDFTVSGPGGSTTYTATLRHELALTRFAIVNPVAAEGIIDEAAKTIIVSYDSNQITAEQIAALKAVVSHNGTAEATVSPDITEARDYTNPVEFTIQDGGVSKTYTVTVQRADLSALAITAFTLKFTPTLSCAGTIDEATQTISVPAPANMPPAACTALSATVTWTPADASIEPDPTTDNDYSARSRQFVLKDANGNLKPYTVLLVAAEITGLAVTTNPTKMIYNTAGEAIDLTGIVIALTDSAGGSTPIADGEYTINPTAIPDGMTGFDNEVPITITHTASDLSTTLTVRAKIIPPPDKKEFTVGAITFNMNKVNAGSFLRQLDDEDPDPADVTTITNAYRMGEFEVTAELLHEVLGKVKVDGDWVTDSTYTATSSRMGSGRNAAGLMSFFAAITFCNKLSERLELTPVYSVSTVADWAALTWNDIPCEATWSAASPSVVTPDPDWNAVTWDREADGFRLPTEMEFIWAAIGADTLNPGQQTNPGNLTELWAGKELGLTLIECSNYSGQGGHGEVGRKAANVLGIYDLNGSVGEIIWDRDDSAVAGSGADRSEWPSGALTDWANEPDAMQRMVKGGSGSQGANANSNLYFCDVIAYPGWGRYAGNGFRVAINEPAD